VQVPTDSCHIHLNTNGFNLFVPNSCVNATLYLQRKKKKKLVKMQPKLQRVKLFLADGTLHVQLGPT
jgi:hypothetical protein